jgi:RNA polymerase sigma factor (sigma-70 family)
LPLGARDQRDAAGCPRAASAQPVPLFTAMTDPEIDTLWLHDRVGRLRAGDRAAADELLQAVGRRLERLARRMLRDFRGVRAGADTADVVQGALLRLVNALRDVRPESTREFTGLAALQVRRELLDLARHFAVRGAGARVPDPGTADFGTGGGDQPADLELWGRFHAAVDGLPADEREAFGLLFYHGHTRAQAALLLGVAERTVYRRWASACVLLNDRLGGQLPPV